jgi:hypothetical protein
VGFAVLGIPGRLWASQVESETWLLLSCYIRLLTSTVWVSLVKKEDQLGKVRMSTPGESANRLSDGRTITSVSLGQVTLIAGYNINVQILVIEDQRCKASKYPRYNKAISIIQQSLNN